ncbi:MAG TPA: AmmeMemoRadiSam system radical SAM enzyme, partial [Nevskiaceae bacterium]|nr:AmmeMemoRadiSam system radical SAM enzyme [Nevskiaceae bacterium]
GGEKKEAGKNKSDNNQRAVFLPKRHQPYFIMTQKQLAALILVIVSVASLIAVGKNLARQETTLLPVGELKEASFYEQLGNGEVRCTLCPNFCVLKEGERGICRVRQNIKGKLYSLIYGKPATIHIDPIEKKPFYHFLPGTKVFSLASAGCNLRCKYCQNWDIAQRGPEELTSMEKSPEQIVEEAIQSGAPSIAITYSEPVVNYEYVLDIAKEAKKRGVKTTIVSAGYINPQPLRELLPYLDAVKIDLKGFNDSFYREIVGGQLAPVLETLKVIKQEGTWFEIVYLVVPGYNDDLKEIEEMAIWIKDNLGENVPLHFSRFHPMYQMKNLPPTPEETVKKARKIALEAGLKYVYTGNIADVEGSTTYCSVNGQPLIVRKGYFIQKNSLVNGQFADCPEKVPGVWQ